MTNAVAPPKPAGRWDFVRKPWAAYPEDPAEWDHLAARALAENARLRTMARVVAGDDGFVCCAEVPPPAAFALAGRTLADDTMRETDHLIGRGHDDAAPPPPAVLDPPAGLVSAVIAAAHEAGRRVDAKPGGRVSLPLGTPRPAAAEAALLEDLPTLCVEVVGAWPAHPGCARALCRHSLLLAGAVDLARPCIARRGHATVLLWSVPVADQGPEFLRHAFDWLEAYVTHGLSEARALAADPTLAGRWLAIHAPHGAV